MYNYYKIYERDRAPFFALIRVPKKPGAQLIMLNIITYEGTHTALKVFQAFQKWM